MCCSAYYHLSQIGKIRDSVSITIYKSHTRTGDMAYRLWQCDTIRRKRLSPTPSGNGPAVRSSNCHANPAGRTAVHDDNTAVITLPACQKAYRLTTSYLYSCTGIYISWHARVSRGTATPARASPIATFCRRVTPRSAKSDLGTYRPPCICLCRTHAVEQTP